MATSPTSPAINGFFYKTEVTPTSDGGLKTVTSKSSTATGTFAPVTSTITDKTGKAGEQTFASGATATDKAAFANSTSLESKARNNQVELSKPFGNNPTAEQKTIINGASGKKNAAVANSGTTNPPTAPDANQQKAIAGENEYKEGTRKEYDLDMRYPINLSLVQDVIKFSILKYSPSLSKENQNQVPGQFGSTKSRVVTLKGGNPIIAGSERIGGITLPIPSGISDSNPVGWEKDDFSMLQSELSEIAYGYFDGGVAGGENAVGKTADKLEGANSSGDASEAVKALFLTKLTGGNTIGRAFGAVFNNNAELLFSGASLRQFSFSFLFYPRSDKESIVVKKIIRAFKQSMSVKRSATSLLLKAPHTFAIQYMTVGKKGEAIQHPYLNRFKECALTSCSVDYAPDGTYMTYDGDEKSMTAYKLGLSFSELEPIFDDEYPEDNDASIGF
jgi:hypothetical protein